MTDEAQGYDPTAQLVSPGTTLYRLMDKMAAEKLPESFDYIRAAFHKSLNAGWHRYQLAVEDKEKGMRDFLVGNPQHISLGLVGHGPRSMIISPVGETSHEGMTEHVWIGLLNDWELSEPIEKPSLADVARRANANRIGTWPFTSVSILNDKYRRPTIQDELDSFFYVLVYCGVRYLKHNCTGVEFFIERFFRDYTLCDGQYSCGQSRRRAMDSGMIKLSNEDELYFVSDSSEPHPLNSIMDNMLTWFQGHYSIMDDEREPRRLADPQGPTEDHPPKRRKYARLREDKYTGEEKKIVLRGWIGWRVKTTM